MCCTLYSERKITPLVKRWRVVTRPVLIRRATWNERKWQKQKRRERINFNRWSVSIMWTDEKISSGSSSKSLTKILCGFLSQKSGRHRYNRSTIFNSRTTFSEGNSKPPLFFKRRKWRWSKNWFSLVGESMRARRQNGQVSCFKIFRTTKPLM